VKILIKLIASGLYAGYSPIAPGTVGSLWGVVLYLLFYRHACAFLFITAVLFVLGFAISERAEALFSEKDSKKIVIDEIASMCLVYIFINPEYIMLVSGFVLDLLPDLVGAPYDKHLPLLFQEDEYLHRVEAVGLHPGQQLPRVFREEFVLV
jgi:phosphatidylglycerophosphatase A